ncbi:hypothetical protein BD779DRAFT_1502899 [Infundibulicybe gibba]|nr:hypothetical protein BD779DRAFT_1502899 [Infundibulicybe gibba]
MYFDPHLEALRGIVDSRALVVPCNDPVLDASACFQNHAVRLFVEAESARGKYECLGNYYLLWTPQKLDGSAWKSVDEATKTAIFNRYIDTLLTPPEDPIPGRLYTPRRLHQLLDRGGIFPLVILRPANTPELTISAGADITDISPDASFMDPSSTLDTRSYLDMDDSAMHDFEISIGSAQISHATGPDAQDALYTSLAAYQFPSPRRARVTAHYPSLSGFRFPRLRIPTAAPLALTDGDLDMLRTRDAAEVRAMHHVMAALPDVRWRDGAAFWKAAEVVSALCVAMCEGGDKRERVLEGVGYRAVRWFQDAGIGFGPGPGVGRIGE